MTTGRIGPDRKTPTERTRYLTPDGTPRSLEEEAELNSSMAAWLNRPEAAACMAYLERLTGAAFGPEQLNTDKLTHQAGQRWIVWLMRMRAAYGNAGLPNRDEGEPDE